MGVSFGWQTKRKAYSFITATIYHFAVSKVAAHVLMREQMLLCGNILTGISRIMMLYTTLLRLGSIYLTDHRESYRRLVAYFLSSFPPTRDGISRKTIYLCADDIQGSFIDNLYRHICGKLGFLHGNSSSSSCNSVGKPLKNNEVCQNSNILARIQMIITCSQGGANVYKLDPKIWNGRSK